MQLYFVWVPRHKLHLAGNQLVSYVGSLPRPAVRFDDPDGAYPSNSVHPAAPDWSAQIDPKGTLGTGSADLAIGGTYLAVSTGVDHLVDEFGVARQDAPVDRTGGGSHLAVAAQ